MSYIQDIENEIVEIAKELVNPPTLGQREYIEWESGVKMRLYKAVHNLEDAKKGIDAMSKTIKKALTS